MSEAIRVEGVTKRFRRLSPGFQLRTLKSVLLDGSLVQGLSPHESVAALEGISFAVRSGEAFGIVGGNGSGKSTLLKIIAGILRPTHGWVQVEGSLAALIELGAGFHPEISGRENIFINGSVLGMSRRQVEERFAEIVDFAELGDFIDEPVKTYSSGMYVRLGFSVAIHTVPEVLLVDEVLAVGDEAFAHRCLRRIEEHLASGGTLLLVSHSLGLVEGLCERALWLDRGLPRMLGDVRRVVGAYRQAVAEREGIEHRAAKVAREASEATLEEPVVETATMEVPEVSRLRWGSGEAEILSVRLLAGSPPSERYHVESGEPLIIEIRARARRRLRDFVFGVGLFTPRGTEVWGTNTELEGWTPERWEGEARVSVSCPALELAAGEYLLDVATHARDGSPYDYRRQLVTFSVTASTPSSGVLRPVHQWRLEGARAKPPASARC